MQIEKYCSDYYDLEKYRVWFKICWATFPLSSHPYHLFPRPRCTVLGVRGELKVSHQTIYDPNMCL